MYSCFRVDSVVSLYALTGLMFLGGVRQGCAIAPDLLQRLGEACRKERSVIRNEDDVVGRARVTTDE